MTSFLLPPTPQTAAPAPLNGAFSDHNMRNAEEKQQIMGGCGGKTTKTEEEILESQLDDLEFEEFLQMQSQKQHAKILDA